uniref:Cryptochrome DASH n=1 Tax=Alexandrium monilatum TaxID=311494 RepID=A0A7S4R5I2_9DINO
MGGSRQWRKVGEPAGSAGPAAPDARSAAMDSATGAAPPLAATAAKAPAGSHKAEGAQGQVAILWLRNDLRLRDNALFHHPAAKRAEALLPVYCFDPRHFAPNRALHPRWEQAAGTLPKTGALRARFIVESVAAVKASLKELRSDLLVLHGKPEELLPEVAAELAQGGRSVRVLCQSEVAVEEAACEQDTRRALEALGSGLEVLWGAQTLYAPEDLPFAPSALPEPFTSFRNAVEHPKRPVAVQKELPRPTRVAPPPDLELSRAERLASAVFGVDRADAALVRLGFGEAEARRTIDSRCQNNFVGGEAAGLERLEAFAMAGLATYKQTRDGFLGANFSSKLSPWMANGCVSPRTVYWRVAAYEDEYGETLDTYWLTFELKWRDFFRFFGVKYGKRIFLRDGPAQKRMTWTRNTELFEKWCHGTTGVPFVDANMRELKLTGFMSNRGRQCVASFLTQDLNLDWRLGAQWFEHALLDHDVCSNYGNWVCAAGAGMRGQRINKFNMAKQAQQYDPKAEYIKLWVPEVARLPPPLAMSPWDASREALERAGCRLGGDYPVSVLRPEYSAEARRRNEQQSRSEGAEVTQAGYPVAKRRWHHGRTGAFLAS